MNLVFLDTNVLLYAVSSARQEADKRDRARALLEQENWVLSIQVLREDLQRGQNFADVRVMNPFR